MAFSVRNRISQKSWIVFVILLFIGAFYALFFLVYAPNQKERIYAEVFRKLERHGENIQHRAFDKRKQRLINASNSKGSNDENCMQQWKEDLLSVIESTIHLYDGSHGFDHFVVIQQDPQEIVYQSLDNRLHIMPGASLDSLLTGYSHGLSAGNSWNIKISEIELRGFVHQIEVAGLMDEEPANLYLCGLMKQQELVKKTRELEPFIFANALILSIILILLMPLLKLKILSPIERLYRSNVVWLGISFIFGMGFVVLISLSTAQYTWEKIKVADRLQMIAGEIRSNFLADIDQSLQLLDDLDDVSIDVPDKSSGFVVTQDDLGLDRNRLIESMTKNVAWIDHKGLLRRLNHFGDGVQPELNSDSIDLSQRTYVKDINGGSQWLRSNKREFGFQAIQSWSDGNFEVAISKKSPEDDVAVIAAFSKFRSVMDVVLPEGYGFCIMDQDGEVLFHSESTKSLQENFLKEIDESDALISMMNRSVDGVVSFTYNNVGHRSYVTPIDQLPLTLVTFQNLDYAKYPLIEIIKITIFLLCIFFFVLGLATGILVLCKYRGSALKRSKFLFHWLVPTPIKKKAYVELLSFHLVLLFTIVLSITLIRCLKWSQFFYSECVVFLITIIPVYLLLFCYHRLYVVAGEGRYAANRAQKYLSRFSNGVLGNLNRFMVFSSIYIVILNVLYFYWFASNGLVLVVVQLILILLYAIRKYLMIPFDGVQLMTRNVYRYFIASWMLLSGVVPVFIFFFFANMHETRIWSKSNLLHIAKEESIQLKKRAEARDQIWNSVIATSIDTQGRALSNLGKYYPDSISYAADIDIDAFRKAPFVKSSLMALLSHVRISSEPLIAKTNALLRESSLLKQGASTGLWRFFQKKSGDLYLKYNEKGESRFIASHMLIQPFANHPWIFIFFWLVFIITLVALYVALTYALRRIFAWDFQYFHSLNLESILKKEDQHPRIFVTSTPGSNTRENIDRYKSDLKETGKTYFEYNLGDLGKDHEKLLESCGENAVIILNNFENLSNSHGAWELKRTFIERLIQLQQKQIIITSSIHPFDVIAFYELMIDKQSKSGAQGIDHNLKESYWHALVQWKKIYGQFYKVYDPIERVNIAQLSVEVYDEEIKKTIKEELSHGTYLSKLEPLVCQYYRNNSIRNKEDLILRIQSLAEPYYYALWSTFKKQERFLIYDLAKDGFINVKNERGIRQLLERGVMRFEENLTLMNESFNNFVLTQVSGEIARDMDMELRNKGNWNLVRSVLAIVVISILIFVVMGHQRMVNDIYKFAVALLGATPLLLRFSDVGLSFFSKSSDKN